MPLVHSCPGSFVSGMLPLSANLSVSLPLSLSLCSRSRCLRGQDGGERRLFIRVQVLLLNSTSVRVVWRPSPKICLSVCLSLSLSVQQEAAGRSAAPSSFGLAVAAKASSRDGLAAACRATHVRGEHGNLTHNAAHFPTKRFEYGHLMLMEL